MTLHTVFFKGNEGGAARWSGLGSQPPAPALVYGEGFVQSNLAFLEHSAAKDLHGKPNTNHFNLFSGECKSGENGKTPLVPVEYRGHFELAGFGQPLICGKYPYHCYGVYGPELAQQEQEQGRMMLPLRLSSDGGPIFVNAKQYKGIMRRRKKRAEAELHNNLLKIRKPYLHLSRHLHAKRRPRGNGGRFLNTKSSTTAKDTRSESNSPAGSEVSSDHDSKPGNEAAALDLFQLNHHLTHSFHQLHHPFPEAGMNMNMIMPPGNYLKV